MMHLVSIVWVSISPSLCAFFASSGSKFVAFFLPLTVCEYYTHLECVDFAIPDCKENATYVPGKDLKSVKHVHHWREGNLPQSSKCQVAKCRKTCWSTECLTGESPLSIMPWFDFNNLLRSNSSFYRIPLWMVWIHSSCWMSQRHVSRMWLWWLKTNLSATTRRVHSKNWSINGG